MGSSSDPPESLTDDQLDKIQGDIWSKGFPKDYETYYFFSIVQDKCKEFAQSLEKLTEPTDPPLISTLRMVKRQRMTIREKKTNFREAKQTGSVASNAIIPRIRMSNALIAFTYEGLQVLQGGPDVEEDVLDLYTIGKTDPVFREGMARDGMATDRKTLNDPNPEKWDALFRSPEKIHGVLKIAGSDKEQVDAHLKEIQDVLLHGTAIIDVPGDSPPTMTESRVDGWTRPNNRGKEHFGFKDGISQPLMAGIDVLEPPTNDNTRTNMNTAPHLLVVSDYTYTEQERTRPAWMGNGSFLVVRKLQQNVKALEDLTDTWQMYNCESKAQMGAKLMGRYQNGDAIALPEYHQNDSGDANHIFRNNNNWGFTDLACPYSAHIRKTNLRIPFGPNDSDPRAKRTRIIRSGIPYGTDYIGNENDTARGLIFACYQSHIEDGFLNMQGHWSNNEAFREDNPGQDPIVGQVGMTASGDNGNLTTVITDKTHVTKQTLNFQQLVTLKGGEYFFVPSLPALRDVLAKL